jgi:5-methyltetrahydrofolate--homocysteine methyltransferase
MYLDREQRDFARQLRNQPTGAEKRLWSYLRARQLDGHKFRRQAALDPYVVDFIFFEKRLVVELDRPQHAEATSAEHDERRTAWLAILGYRVMRFRNHGVDDDVRLVVEMIRQAIKVAAAAPLHPPSPTLPSEGREPDSLARVRLSLRPSGSSS